MNEEPARQFVGRWSGTIRSGAEQAHDDFVAELHTPEAQDLLARYSLSQYAMYRHGSDLEVIFKSEKPTIIPGFLRNKRFWPEFWEFSQPGTSDEPEGKELVFRWLRPVDD